MNRLHRFGFLIIPILALGISAPSNAAIPQAQAQETTEAQQYITSFIISAYYSPLLGQNRYVTGSYEGDIQLNGRGTNGADGTPVYPGMIAAPKKYPFGTKMNIPGIGITTVHDRGGAIVAASVNGHAYDRLDIWMGHGDEGLIRALKWGKRTVENVTVYGIDPSIQDRMELAEVVVPAHNPVQPTVKQPEIFTQDLTYQNKNDDVKRLQEILTKMGYFTTEITGYYGEETFEAVVQFQKDNQIVSDRNEWGAGHVGLNTRRALDLAVARMREEEEQVNQQKVEKALTALTKYSDLAQRQFAFHRTLQLGTKGEDVKALQEELAQMGFLRINAKHYGYYGPITEHAVFKLQQKWKLVGDKTSTGAGIFGPKTRDQLNQIVKKRIDSMGKIAIKRDEKSTTQDTAVDENFTRTLALGDRGEDVQNLQKLLKELGFFKGAFVTPFYGEQTKAAINAFQMAQGLVTSAQNPSAGKMDEATRQALNELS